MRSGIYLVIKLLAGFDLCGRRRIETDNGQVDRQIPKVQLACTPRIRAAFVRPAGQFELTSQDRLEDQFVDLNFAFERAGFHDIDLELFATFETLDRSVARPAQT